ncbi:unnamed protein product, partial [Porites evermanni]
LRAALFPAPKGKHPLRTITYPINDGINYAGIRFQKPVGLERINVVLTGTEEVLTLFVCKKIKRFIV